MKDLQIGLEIHAQMQLGTKLFCSCEVRDGATPNSCICPVCTGHPGALPVLNTHAAVPAVRLAHALKMTVSENWQFARKNYFYPDLPKGYQITMHRHPVAVDGELGVDLKGSRKIRIQRIHLEEDAAKIVRSPEDPPELIRLDFNRSGVPLLEIVTEPDIRSPDEARRFAQTCRNLLVWLGISACDMELGQLRFDANISISNTVSGAASGRVEIKNLNSFKFMHDALTFEAERLRSAPGTVSETRGYDSRVQRTFFLRSKASHPDYRYFPEPDLPAVRLTRDWITHQASLVPALPDTCFRELTSRDGIAVELARTICSDRQLWDWYAYCRRATGQADLTARIISGPILYLMTRYRDEWTMDSPRLDGIVSLIIGVKEGRFSWSMVKQMLTDLILEGTISASRLAGEGSELIRSVEELERMIHQVLEANPDLVSTYLQGRPGIRKFFIGQVMKRSQGRADPVLVGQILDSILGDQ